jgi:hypothetical protein
MVNRYTMVALTESPENQSATIIDAGRAMQSSSQPARVVILADDTPQNRLDIASTYFGNVRSHILATTPPESVSLSPFEMDQYGEKKASNMLNSHNLILILIENENAPGFDMTSLSDPILEHNENCEITFYPTPWTYKFVPADLPSRPPHSDSERLPPSTYPNMFWCRSEIPAAIIPPTGPLTDIIKSTPLSDRPSQDDMVHAILACLGTTPVSVKFSYAFYAPSTHFFNEPPLFTSIPKIILYSTLDIYRKSEAMRKWKT